MIPVASFYGTISDAETRKGSHCILSQSEFWKMFMSFGQNGRPFFPEVLEISRNLSNSGISGRNRFWIADCLIINSSLPPSSLSLKDCELVLWRYVFSHNRRARARSTVRITHRSSVATTGVDFVRSNIRRLRSPDLRGSRSLDPTRVVFERSDLVKGYALTRWDGFILSQSSGTTVEVLAECQRIAPCVLVASQESLEKLDANEFRASLGVEGSVRVLVLATHKGPNMAEKFLSMGCMGYLPDDVPRSTLRRAVRAIASGQVWADRSTITQVMRRMILKQLLQELTLRERDILRLIASGLSNRTIADRLCITYETVRWHIRGLYSKLGVQDRFSAIVYGKRLLDSDGVATPSEIPSFLISQSSGDAPQRRASPKAAREAEGKLFLIS